ncbi:MAG: hypothetical protein IJA12_07790 [Oscillospiraceae bacterium]|nr:hypothetical protein [Oscillospiraceae bacterium]
MYILKLSYRDSDGVFREGEFFSGFGMAYRTSCEIFEPILETQVNSVGYFSFTVYPSHPLYDFIDQPKSLLEIVRYNVNEPLFIGRMAECRTGFYNEKMLTFESELAFLLDSVRTNFSSETSYSTAYWLDDILRFHNTHAGNFGDIYQTYIGRKFECGNVSESILSMITQPDAEEFRGTFSTLEIIQKLLLEKFGGVLKIRHENGVNYIDWLDEEDLHVSSQKIELSKNLILLEQSRVADEIVTAIRPIGDNVTSSGEPLDIFLNNASEYLSDNGIFQVIDGTVSETSELRFTDTLYSKSLVDKYGWIQREVLFEGVTNVSALVKKAERYLLGISENTSITVNAADLANSDNCLENFSAGEIVMVNSPVHFSGEQKMSVQSVRLDLSDPTACEITLGNQAETITSQSVRSSSSTASGSKSNTTDTNTCTVDLVLNSTSENPVQNKVITKKFNDIETRVSASETDISDLQTSISTHENEMGTLNSNVSALQSGLSATSSSLSNTVKRVTNLETTVSEHTTSISNIGKTVSDNSTRITSLEQSNTTNKSDISILQTQISTHADSISTNATDIEELKKRTAVNLFMPDTSLSYSASGITMTINPDGTFILNGTATATITNCMLHKTASISGQGKYLHVFLLSGTAPDNFSGVIAMNSSYGYVCNATLGNPAKMTDTAAYAVFRPKIISGDTFTNAKFGVVVTDAAVESYIPYIADGDTISEKVDNAVSALQYQLDTNTAEISKTSSTVTNIGNAVTSQSTRITTLEQETTGQYNTLNSEIKTMQSDISDIQTELTQTTSKATDAYKGLVTANTNISNLETRVGTNEDDISCLVRKPNYSSKSTIKSLSKGSSAYTGTYTATADCYLNIFMAGSSTTASSWGYGRILVNSTVICSVTSNGAGLGNSVFIPSGTTVSYTLSPHNQNSIYLYKIPCF